MSDRYVVYRGGSMYPTLRDHELIVVEPLGDRSPRKGDVIVFASPKHGYNIIHRVVSVSTQAVQTRGDNNDCVDEFRPGMEDILGRVIVVCRGRKDVRIPGGLCGVWYGLFMRNRNALARLTLRRWCRNPVEIRE